MATSGKVNTTAYDSRYIEFAWSRKSYDTATNKTVISWTLTARGKGQYSQYSAAPFLVKIDGAQVYYSATRITTKPDLQIASGEHTFTHNADGSKSFSVSVQAAIYYKAYNVSGSGTFALDNIPRRAELTLFSWDNDEADIKVSYTNPAGNSVSKLELTLYGDKNYKIGSRTLTNKAGGDYNFVLTDAERELVWGYFNKNNKTKIDFSIELITTIGSTTLSHALTRISLPMINHEPTITFTYTHLNEDVKEATGIENKLLTKLSDISYTFTVVPQKGATITEKCVSCGLDYTVYNTDSDTITDINADGIVLIAEDNRGGMALQNVVLDTMTYLPLATEITADIALSGETTADITLGISGDFHNANFGVKNNTLSMSYRIKTNNGDYTEWVKITGVSLSVNKYGEYSFDYTIPTPLNYQNKYTVQVMAADLFMTVYSNEVVLKALPVFDWSNSDFNFNVPVSIQGNPLADCIIETGNASMGSNGTWYWRKWASGRAECWGIRNFGNMAVSQAWGSLFTSSTFTQDLPSGLFLDAPSCSIEIHNTTSGLSMIAKGGTAPTATSTGGFLVVRGASITLSQVNISFQCVGYWK